MRIEVIPAALGAIVRKMRPTCWGCTTRRVISAAICVVGILCCASILPASPLGGTVHDLSANSTYLASGGNGLCIQCHLPHGSQELVLWGRDLTPDALEPDELCLDCHGGSPPSWAAYAKDVSRFNGSLHDFTGRSIADRTACGACHIIHLTDPGAAAYEGTVTSSVRMWGRDLTEEFTDLYQVRDLGQSASVRPDYLIGRTALCYDCHSGNHVDSEPDVTFDFDNDPKDIAFDGDRQTGAGGSRGYYELPDGREPDDPLDAPDLNEVSSSPEVHVPGGHYVLSRMDAGTVDDNYQVRTPSGRFLYEISVGDKMPCELCHDPHMGELNSATDDEAFFRRQIFAGEDALASNNDDHFSGRIFKTSSASRAGQGGGENDGTGREMCQWCHGSSDWDGSTLSSSSGINPLIVTSGDPVITVYGIKVRTASHPDGSPAFPPPDTILAHRSSSIQPCTDCHDHGSVQLPGEGCLGCHSSAKAAERETPAEDMALGIDPSDFDSDGHGAASWGLEQGRECVYCHLSTSDLHPAQPLDMANNPYRLRTYGPGGPANDICLVCHSGAGSGINADNAGNALTTANSSLNVDTAHWGIRHGGLDSGDWCWDCHNPHGNGAFTQNAKLIWQRPSASSSSTTGQLISPTSSSVLFTPLTGSGSDYARLYTYNGICQVCHTDPGLKFHVFGDASKNGHMNTPAGGSVCTSCHLHDEAFREPVCYDCHGDGSGSNWPDGSPAIVFPDRQGSHQKHIDAIGSGNGSCHTCHPGNPPVNHLTLSATGGSQAELHQMDLDSNGTADAWSGSYFRNIAGVSDVDGLFDAAANTCANIDCHGGVLTPDWYAPVVIADTQPPVWGTGSGVWAVDAGTGGALLVSWNTAVDVFPSDPVTYELYMATADSSSAVFAGPPVFSALAGYSALVTGLSNGTNYYFGVRASDSWTTPNVTTNSDISAGAAPVALIPSAPCGNVSEDFDVNSLGSVWLVQKDGSTFPWAISGGNLMMAADPGDYTDPPRATLNYADLNHSSENYNMTIDAHIIDDDYVTIFFYTNQTADRGYAVVLSEQAGKGHGIYRVEGISLSGLAEFTLLSSFDNQPADSGGVGSDYTISIQVRTTVSGDVVISAWYDQLGGSLGIAGPVTDTTPNRSSGTIGFGTGSMADGGQSFIRNIILVCSSGGSGTCTVNPAGTYVDAENFNLLIPGANAHLSVATSLGPYIGSGNIQTYGTANMNDISGDRMDYHLDFPAPATYYMWIRGRGLDATSDSFHIGGHYTTNGRVLIDDIRDAWFWSREFSPFPIPGATNAINFAAGAGTINLWASELGALIDGFYISTDPNPPPGLTPGPGASYLGTVPLGSAVINPSSCWPDGDTFAPIWSGGLSGIAVTDPSSGGSLIISWNSAVDAASPPVTYSLYRSTIQADVFAAPDLTWTGLGVTSIVDTGLTNGQTYWYGVRAVDSSSPVSNATNNMDTASGNPSAAGTGLTCTSCHQTPPVSPENTGSHPSHANTDNDYTDCDLCHPGASSYLPAHQDGIGQLGFDSTPYSAIYGSVTLTVSDGSADLYVDADGYGVLTGIAGDGVDNGICSNVSCHGAATPVWGGTLSCGSCHGKTIVQEDRSSFADSEDHPQGAPPFDLAGGIRPDAEGKHLQHLNVSYFQLGASCGLCHEGAGVENITLHGDGAVDLAFNSVAGTNAAYDDATSTCSGLDGVNCHGDSIWDPASVLLCADCHGSASPAAGVGTASPHTGMGQGYTCEGCHTSHSGGTIMIPNLTSVGISYAASGIALGGSQAVGATEAEICWNCHDSQAAPVSEWQTTRIDTNGTWPDYDYGLLHDNTGNWGARVRTSNWVTAWWDSPNYSYKTERIQSTHAANASAGVAGVDAVSSIRCSYCHDVHDTKAGSPSGSPYLRGTWMQNPYPEDGAPRWDAGGDQHSYAENQSYGAVPRGNRGANTSHVNTSGRPAVWTTEMGGYWIDQNSGFPTRDDPNYDTPEETAGLCEMCHGDGDGVWSPTEIDSIDQFPANNWFGGNGHANAVIGGTGAASPLATNIMTQAARSNAYTCTSPGVFNGDDLWDRACMGYYGQASGNELYGVRNNDEASWFYRNRDRRSGVFPIAENPDEARRARFAYDINRGAGFEWGDWLVPTDPPLTQDNVTVDDHYHQFTCSKCHNPHASRLPRLVVTNCLDVDKNTYDDQIAFDGRQGFTNDNDWAAGANGPYTDLVQAPGNRELSYLTTAQNCHRSVDTGTGWNRVTPW